MVVFGLILVLLAVGAAAFAVWVATAGSQVTAADGSSALAVDVAGNQLQVQTLSLVILGAAAILVGLFGLWIMMAASRRKYRAARERRDLQKRQRRQEKELAETRRRLGEDERTGRPAQTGAPRRDEERVVTESRVEETRVEPARDGRLGEREVRDDRSHIDRREPNGRGPVSGDPRGDGATAADVDRRPPADPRDPGTR